jgi:NAD(P)-dependent dehydrogenase (short-subunit alcohol dehydrogenase family)
MNCAWRNLLRGAKKRRMLGNWALLGTSRGLGAEFYRLLHTQEPQAEILRFSRTPGGGTCPSDKLWVAADFAASAGQTRVLERLADFAPAHVVYFAGGGPYGPFAKPEWQDHRWAMEVTFLFAARLTHFLLRLPTPPQSLTLIGSAIAEDNGEPHAASYAAAKAALRALFESLARENLPTALRLFSPGYIDTRLLPPRAAPRRWASQLWSPAEVARELYRFIRQEPAPARRRLTPYRHPALVKGDNE